MTALNRTPINTNLLQSDGFMIAIRRLPTTIFFTQQIQMPGFSCQPTEQPTPFVSLPVPGDHIVFEDLAFSFKIDEDLKNFIEIYNWMQALYYPDDFGQYADIAAKSRAGLLDDGIYSDISVLITTNLKNPNIEFVFRNAFPIQLDGFSLDTTDGNASELSSRVAFKFEKFDISILPKPQ